MPVTRKDVLRHELIGLKATILSGSDPTLIGREGVIVDETRNTIKLDESGELKVIPKKEVTLSVDLPKGEKVKIGGNKLVCRPEDRVKKYR